MLTKSFFRVCQQKANWSFELIWVSCKSKFSLFFKDKKLRKDEEPYLDFYQFSTNQQYFEAHLEHNFAGFFTNKVPLLRKAKLEEFIGGGYLSSPEKRNYKEFYFGFQRLVLRASYGFAYDGARKLTQGFRIAYTL